MNESNSGEMTRFLLPEERILWQGQPDVVFRQKRKFRTDWTMFVGIILALCLILGFVTLRDHPNTSLPELVGSLAQVALMISIPAWPLFILDWRRQPRIHAKLLQKPPPALYAVTNMRMLVLESAAYNLWSAPLDSVEISRKKRGHGVGSIRVHAQPTSTTTALHIFIDIADVETVYQLILDAQKTLH
ncbi:MAG: hypothetical protein U0670_12795 [Anaerolineae bacterium]